jgi:hypothetical protein
VVLTIIVTVELKIYGIRAWFTTRDIITKLRNITTGKVYIYVKLLTKRKLLNQSLFVRITKNYFNIPGLNTVLYSASKGANTYKLLNLKYCSLNSITNLYIELIFTREYYLLRCYCIQSRKSLPMFRRNVLSPSSESKSKPNK